jgi:hypothetical protein
VIVLYLVIIWCWNLPEDSPSKWLIRPLTRPVLWLGLWHGWNMFAPNPVRESRRLAVQVQYADGSRYEWRPPGTLPEKYWPAFLHARFRKFVENVCVGKIKSLRPSLAEYGLRRLGEVVPGNPVPTHVAIIEESWPVVLGKLPQPNAEPVRKVLFEGQVVNGRLT